MHNNHTNMPNLTNLRIHIAPVGYEIDRIVLPAKEMKADKVFLLVHENPSEDKATKFYNSIDKKLQKLNIETEKVYHNRLNLFQIIKSVKQLIESQSNDSVYVNLASGSKIQSVGCMMACQMFNDNSNVSPYYVEAKEYTGFSGEAISKGIKEIQGVPTFEIQKPDSKLIQALKIIKDKEGKLSKKEMAKLAVENNLISVNAENESQATFASLDQNIISPLEKKWGFIEIEKIGRTRWIKITNEGINVSEFLI
jgi:hypothetical protein